MSSGFRALVVGASGYIGTNPSPRLMEEGWQVRAAARHQAVLEARAWKGAEPVEADALDPDTLPAALNDIDVEFCLVHSMAAWRAFAKLDIEAAKNFAAAAAEAGVKRIVYLGGPIPARSALATSEVESGNRGRFAARCRTGNRDSSRHDRGSCPRPTRSFAISSNTCRFPRVTMQPIAEPDPKTFG